MSEEHEEYVLTVGPWRKKFYSAQERADAVQEITFYSEQELLDALRERGDQPPWKADLYFAFDWHPRYGKMCPRDVQDVTYDCRVKLGWAQPDREQGPPVTWVVQSNLGKQSDIAEIGRACASLGYGFYPFKAIPFMEERPDVPLFSRTIFYGATNFIKRTQLGHWSPGAWYDEDKFSITSYLNRYDCLNRDGEITTLGEFATRSSNKGREFFVRPVKDMKEFAGAVVTGEEALNWYQRISHGGFTVKPDCLVLVAEPKPISDEWRLFIVNGEVVSGSRYRRMGHLRVDSWVPPDVVDFAQEQIQEYQPAPVFCMDVTGEWTQPGSSRPEGLKVVEIGSFNSCGFYAADIHKIVRAVSEFVVGTKA